ncbi:MAG TPA: DUF2897 family protein [Steroidobacteraceae bacterium]|jgi:hypothetical protein
MFKVIVIFVVVLAVLIGGMLALRTSRNTGMPGEDVLKRTAERARQQAAKDQAER